MNPPVSHAYACTAGGLLGFVITMLILAACTSVQTERERPEPALRSSVTDSDGSVATGARAGAQIGLQTTVDTTITTIEGPR